MTQKSHTHLDSASTVPHTNRVFRRFGHIFLIIALLAAMGGHWAVLQSIAWTNMMLENMQTESFEAALKKTFDGKHPCPLCKKIESGKKSEKKSEFQSEIKKLEFSYVKGTFVFTPPSGFYQLGEVSESSFVLNNVPPSPPPKSLQG